ncbi:hypothetical protein GCM10027062_08150 [Nocardioides hungaricus]
MTEQPLLGFDLQELDPAYGKRAEFGELVRAEGRRLNARSHAQIDGATNLLTKALARQEAGDAEQADRLIDRAAAMPYDARDEGSPGVRAAGQLVYVLVSDWLEASAEDDMSWLTAAVEAHSRVDGAGRAYLASTVHGFVLQDLFFTTSRAEQRLIRATFADAPLEADLGDGPELPPDGRASVIRSLLTCVRALEQAYAEAQRTG